MFFSSRNVLSDTWALQSTLVRVDEQAAWSQPQSGRSAGALAARIPQV